MTERVEAALRRLHRGFAAERRNQLVLAIKRRRAVEISELIATGEVGVPTFEAEILKLYGSGLVVGEDKLPADPYQWDDDQLDAIQRGLDDDSIEIHGNQTWTFGTNVYAPNRTAEERQALLDEAIGILNDAGRTPRQKAEDLRQVHGFGQNLATGLAMYQAPAEIALWNTFSSDAVRALGYAVSGLPSFQQSASELRQRLGLPDFIELDWFLWWLHHGPLQPFRESFLRRLPDFSTFQDPDQEYVSEERAYKLALAEVVREHLAEEFLQQAGGVAVCQAFHKVMIAPGQNLVGWRAFGWLTKVELDEAEVVAGALRRLLYGAGDAAQRVAEFNGQVWPVLTRHYPKTSWAASRELPTCLLMLSDPQRQLFIKTTPIEAMCRVFEPQWRFSAEPLGAEEYRHCLMTAEHVQDYLLAWGWAPQDMIDVQSFVWVASRAAEPVEGRHRPRMVKIAPDHDGKEWPLCHEHGYIGTAWNEPGDLRQYENRDAFQAAFAESWSHRYVPSKLTEKANEVWTLMELQPGDLVVANRGTSEILGIGTVVQPGYERREPNGGRILDTVRVDWDTSKAGPIPVQGYWAMKTVAEVDGPLRRLLLRDIEGPCHWLLQCSTDDWDVAANVADKATLEDRWWVDGDDELVAEGDSVVLGQDGQIFGLGKLTGDPYIDEGEAWVGFGLHRIFDPPVSIPDDLDLGSGNSRMVQLSDEDWTAVTKLLPPWPPLVVSLPEIRNRIETIGLHIDERTLRRYHLALQTRGFVILSGISGSGKTWLTKAYADAVGAKYELVAVASNWTTNEDLLGYVNPFDGGGYRDTTFSTYLRAAAAEWAAAENEGRRPVPYHLVLDEMNLARIEYYFAEFLSKMELRARDETAFLRLGEEKVPLTDNLKFVGTVNIDETTHGFADKVYDRATLIELRPSRAELEAHLKAAPYAATVMEIWDCIHPVAPFGFRVLTEIMVYIEAAQALDVPWQDALDEQILQKILPKVRGADTGIEGVLGALIELLGDEYSLSRDKADTMRKGFGDRGFASYF